jgi:hypothetical protein
MNGVICCAGTERRKQSKLGGGLQLGFGLLMLFPRDFDVAEI